MITVNLYIRVLRALRDKLAKESAVKAQKAQGLTIQAAQLEVESAAARAESQQLLSRSIKLTNLLDDE